MFTVLFLDEEYEYEKFDYNIIDDSSIIFTKCFNQGFLNTLYIKGIKTILLLRPTTSFIDKVEEVEESHIDYTSLLEIIGVMPDLIVTKLKLKSKQDKNNNNNNNIKEPVIVDTDILYNGAISKLSDLITKIVGLERKKSESYENLVKLIDENKETFVQVEDSPDKFQKTMEKEATKLKYAENRERYMIKMRQSSLSNKKSTSKSSITSDPSNSANSANPSNLSKSTGSIIAGPGTVPKSFIAGIAGPIVGKEKKKKKSAE